MDPFDIFKKIQNEINRQFDRFDRSVLAEYRKPSCNISQDQKSIKIDVDLPGIDRKNIILHIGKQEVEIRGERKKREIKKHSKIESYKGYYRVISIPADVLPDEAKAKFKRSGGVVITIPKIKKVTKKKIRIS